VTLCDLLDRLSRELGFHLFAAHLNHGLRGAESDADERSVREFCAGRGIPLEVTSAPDLQSQAQTRTLSIEMAAREERFAFLSRTAQKLSCKVIALGHTADDLAETLLLRLLRGSGGRGLAGLRPVRTFGEVVFLRPLLGFHRREIMAYLESNGLPYRIDATNLSLDTDRGRVRNAILPELERLAEEHGWRNVRESLVRSTELLSEDEEFLDEMAAAGLSSVEFDAQDSFRLDRELLGTCPPPILARVILEAIIRIDPDLRPEREHIRHIEDMVAGRRTEAIDIPGGLRAELDGRYLTVRRPGKEETLIPPDPVDIRPDDLPMEFEFGPFRLFFSLYDASEERTQTGVGPSHDSVSIAAPVEIRAVRVRAPEPGDKMAPLGMDGHTKKLSDIFIDKKVPQRERYVQPIVVDASNGNILAIPALGLVSEQSRISSNSMRRLDIVVCRVTG